ncbi:acyl-CoA dehydrogenase family protein [Verrucosispora sp. TAA-831]|uniref:acyl-CoA dehydrogenase family protein n=1 Tax=Verrucosispora sp. TAA-831 TaxID=3422227 RepID=UPI003D6ED55C
MTSTSVDPASLQGRAAVIADEVTSAWAAAVDREGRFPTESFGALRQSRLLSALVPPALGGEGAGVTDVAQAVDVLARRCASTALIFAMHQIQVACLVRHGRSRVLQDVLREVADQQILLGSATSEQGGGDDIRASACAIHQRDGVAHVDKRTRVISYAEEADAILVTARRTPTGPLSDQILMACRRNDLDLQRTGEPELMGLRGTRSLPYRLRATAPLDAVLDDSFETILATTMLPVAHTLWAAAWLGIATGALERASRFVQAAARRAPGTMPIGAVRLAGLSAAQQQLRELVYAAARRLDERDGVAPPTPDDTVFMNNLKVSASALCVDVVSGALVVIGMAGYREEGEYAMGRMLRDAYGGLVMVNNDRVLNGTAQFLLSVRRW